MEVLIMIRTLFDGGSDNDNTLFDGGSCGLL